MFPRHGKVLCGTGGSREGAAESKIAYATAMKTMKVKQNGKLMLTLAAVACLYLSVFLWIGHYGAFWSEDAGVKYLQASSLADSNWTTASIEYPGKDVDPQLEFNPLAGAHTRLRNGQIHSIYPVFFPAISSLFLHAWGFPGLYVLPLLSTLLVVALSFFMAKLVLSEKAAFPVAVITACATPLLFYAFTFWEVNLAAAALVAGLLLSLRIGPSAGPKTFLAGMLLGSVVFFRAELVLFFAAYMAARMIVRKDWGNGVRLLAGGGMVTLVFLALQYVTEETWLAHYFQNLPIPPAGSAARWHFLRHTWRMGRELLFAGHGNEWLNLLLLAPVAALSLWLILRERMAARKTPPNSPPGDAAFAQRRGTWTAPVLLGLVLLAHLAYLGLSLMNRYPILSTPVVSGLFVFSPWAALGLVQGRDKNPLRTEIHLAVVGFIAALCLTTPVSGGLQWGPRLLVPVYPLLVLLSWDACSRLREKETRRRPVAAACLCLVAVSMALQGWGLCLLKDKKAFNSQVMNKLSNLPAQTVLTSEWWVPLSLAPVFHQKDFFVVHSPADLGRLLTLLAKNKRTEFVLVAGKDARIVQALDVFFGLRPMSEEQVSSGTDAYFSVRLLRYRLRPAQNFSAPVQSTSRCMRAST